MANPDKEGGSGGKRERDRERIFPDWKKLWSSGIWVKVVTSWVMVGWLNSAFAWLVFMRFDWKEKNLLRHSLSTFFKQRFFSDLFSLHESNCVTVGRQAPKSRDSSTPGLGSEVLVPMSVAPFIKWLIWYRRLQCCWRISKLCWCFKHALFLRL